MTHAEYNQERGQGLPHSHCCKKHNKAAMQAHARLFAEAIGFVEYVEGLCACKEYDCISTEARKFLRQWNSEMEIGK